MKASCRLIDDRMRASSSVALEAARLLGMRVDRRRFPGDGSYADLNADASLIAIGFDLRHLSPSAQSQLKTRVTEGATLHVRGGAGLGQPWPFAPFADGQLMVSRTIIAAGYRLTDHPRLPVLLRNEERVAAFRTPVALDPPIVAEPLLLARGADGIERPTIFLVRTGNGVVIYDLAPDAPADNRTTLAMLEDPAGLPAAPGALAAANIAWGLGAAESHFNLVIDDRPANFDYFNCSRMFAFLRHLEDNFPGTHVDFAWTPDQSHPSHRYVAAMKSFRAGFVWHGLRRHVDHRPIADLSAEFGAGRYLVEQVSSAYGVRFQPVMIFPFERDTPRCVEFLQDQGFVAKAQTPAEHAAEASEQPAPETARDRFVVLERFPMRRLTRDRMLALAVLGLPIIAAAHPPDIGLVRLVSLRPQARGSFAHFDPVLRFAAEKHLQPASLEELAHRAIARG